MRVRVSGEHTEIGETLPAAERLAATFAKLFDGSAETKVVFIHDGPFYRADGARRPVREISRLRGNKCKLSNHHAKACARSRVSA